MTSPSPVPDRPAPQSSTPPSEDRISPETAPTPPGDEAPVPVAPVTPHGQSEVGASSQAATPPGDLHGSDNDSALPDQVSAPRHLGTPVPFAAPPRDRDSTRLAVTIIASVFAVVLLCGGGVVGLGLALASAGEAMATQAHDAADTFMQDIADEDFSAAYDSMCEPLKEELTEEEFTAEWDALNIETYETGDAYDTLDGTLRVPVEARSPGDRTYVMTLTVGLAGQSMEMQVCGWDAD
ncbi:MAG TPA: hypothetical protein H9881_01520 [Candidatus Stackebrandtia excrementipullorum]|nr:hypothetical protein [Candidatus Stackebrandtia excrementipullorum]